MSNVSKAKVLLVDDDLQLRSTLTRALQSADFVVESVANGGMALAAMASGANVDVIVTDLVMPGMDGLDFLRSVRLLDLDVPVIVLTGHPSITSAAMTVEHGGYRYLTKPIELGPLIDTVTSAAAMHRLAVLKRRALELCDSTGWQLGDPAKLEAHFESALRELWMAFQPIVGWKNRTLHGYEALMRSRDGTLANPGLILDAAERLGRVHEVGRKVRRLVADAVVRAPSDSTLFINLHSVDLNDEDLYAPTAALTKHAARVVLEITERSSLERVTDIRGRMRALRGLGYRIAVDDLGAGYAGLSSFGQLEPDIVKLDMSLVRGIDGSSRMSSIVRSMIAVCEGDLETVVVCEGVETEAERDTLHALGADLLQGYLFGRPEQEFSKPRLGSVD